MRLSTLKGKKLKKNYPPMTSAYAAIFVLSLVLMATVFFGSVASQSKSGGFGIWWWGLTAWLMYKRNNSRLKTMFKVMLWFEVICCAVFFGYMVIAKPGERDFAGLDIGSMLVLFAIAIGLALGYYLFFKKQVEGNLNENNSSKSLTDDIEDKTWEMALLEINGGKRVEGIWARAYAEADGDESKAKAKYLKIRVEQIQSLASDRVQKTAVKTVNNLSNSAAVLGHKSIATMMAGIAILIIVFIVFTIYKNEFGHTTTEASSVPPNKMESTDPEEIFHNAMMEKKSGKFADGVNYIRKNIERGVIQKFENNEINGTTEKEPYDASNYKLGAILEANEYWWRDKRRTLNIAIYNPYDFNVSRIRFELYPDRGCKPKSGNETKSYIMKFEKPLGYKMLQVYSFELPFEWSEWAKIGNGDCLLIVKAW